MGKARAISEDRRDKRGGRLTEKYILLSLPKHPNENHSHSVLTCIPFPRSQNL